MAIESLIEAYGKPQLINCSKKIGCITKMPIPGRCASVLVILYNMCAENGAGPMIGLSCMLKGLVCTLARSSWLI